ncbi:hypothetical protein ACFHYQ_13045 [Sphaerimonospora cavernae]|uniref:DUF1440 domain-containing protein n=1 Tax=Sphaerimonospora cavernae TaxID=1740611 RepID=A0ABV6U449_9ACTN
MNGAIGGGLATAVYSAMSMAGDRAGLLGPRPPKRIAGIALPGRPRRTSGDGILGTISHFVFGAASGALLGLLSTGQRIPVPLGTAYGLAVWYAGYQGLMPPIGTLPPASEIRMSRHVLPVASHLLWGTTLVLALNRLRPEKPTPFDKAMPSHEAPLTRHPAQKAAVLGQ